jgi:CRP/FNR family transcriptional regulator, anaerobic regulatory protein
MAPGTPQRPEPVGQPIADDGDDFHFCSTCAFSAACLKHGYDKSQLRELHVLVEHTEPYQEGEHIFREGDRFDAIAAVRSGTVKTYVNDIEGREQVQGFFLPGEVIGLSGISEARYPSNAIALESVVLCRFSFSSMAMLATRLPGVQQQLFRLLSQDINKAALLAGNYSADERMAAFLVSLSRRYAARGFSPNRFRLTMTRTDIANYLRLASESVSRGLRRLQDDGLVRVERRDIELVDRPALKSRARSILRD